ncbi:MAG: hypothetical protein ACTHN5_05470 [Phycisphaerae bacterium]
MKCLMAVVVFPLLFASCAQPIQKIVDEHRSERMHEAYGNNPVTYGAADGIGTTNAQAHAVSLAEDGRGGGR